jgi:hypothetical protein
MLLGKYILDTNWEFPIYCISQLESIFLLLSFVGFL